LPDEAVQRALYPERFYRRADADRRPRNMLSLALGWYMALTAGERLRWVGSPTGGRRLLDVGCGNGAFLRQAREAGWEGVGVEPSGASARDSHDSLGVTVLTCNLEEAPLDPGSFDVVSFWHVLEHVTDFRSALRAAARLLAPGGGLVIAVPNFESWECRFYRNRWALFDVPRHVNFFTPANLRMLLGECRLEVEREGQFSWEFTAPIAVQSLLNAVCGEPMLLYKLAKREYAYADLGTRGRVLRNLALSVTAALTLGPFAAAASAGVAALRRGSTVTLRARKG
jgi:SAM-dependent methyltransferase